MAVAIRCWHAWHILEHIAALIRRFKAVREVVQQDPPFSSMLPQTFPLARILLVPVALCVLSELSKLHTWLPQYALENDHSSYIRETLYFSK